MFRTGSVTLLRVRGVPIRAHWTLLLIIPYLAFALASDFGSVTHAAGLSSETLVLPPLAWGAILAIGLFVSIAIHELAHTVVATRFGGRQPPDHADVARRFASAARARAGAGARDEALMAGGRARRRAWSSASSLIRRARGDRPSLTRRRDGAVLPRCDEHLARRVQPRARVPDGRRARAARAARARATGRARATAAAATVGRVFAVGFGIVAVSSKVTCCSA